jgi:hypothetical protein
MNNQILTNTDTVQVLTPDYALAYATLSRRVATIDAFLRSGMPVDQCILEIRVEIEEAMKTIEAVDTISFVVHPSDKFI